MRTTSSIQSLSAPLLAAALVASSVGLPAAGSRQAASPQPGSPRATNGAPRLTLDAIARDNAKWIGTPPADVRWSVDGRQLYFTWNPDRADVPDLYTLPV